tara:strand:+ start:27324 stop:27509 length:186 start_codon:yes stop_codon:yes gene_type:complete
MDCKVVATAALAVSGRQGRALVHVDGVRRRADDNETPVICEIAEVGEERRPKMFGACSLIG